MDFLNVNVNKCVNHKVTNLLLAYVELALNLVVEIMVGFQLELSILVLKEGEEIGGTADIAVALSVGTFYFEQGILPNDTIGRSGIIIELDQLY